MAFPSVTLASGTVAQSTLANACITAGITNPTGGLSMVDLTAGVVGNLLADAAPNQGTGQARNAKFTLTTTASAQTAAADALTGAGVVVAEYTAVNGALTTRTGAQMCADAGLLTGSSYFLAIVNLGTAGTVTLTAAATGVTLTGTMTIANNTWRGFVVTVTAANTMTFQSVMIGTIG